MINVASMTAEQAAPSRPDGIAAQGDAVTERPMLFSAPMVRALLAGTKTQTRRVVKVRGYDPSANTPGVHHPIEPYTNGSGSWNFVLSNHGHSCGDPFPCPYGQPGDRLWVRERGWIAASKTAFMPFVGNEGPTPASPDGTPYKACPSIHMPRWASRITLEVTGVRVERLQGISRGDAMDEGCPFPNMAQGPDPRDWYRELWESINGAGSWDANPWVWAISFKRTNVSEPHEKHASDSAESKRAGLITP